MAAPSEARSAMPETDPFDTYAARYDSWFERHESAYYSELLAVRALLPWHGLGLEIGVGSGRFAEPLGIQIGVDPSRAMLEQSISRRRIIAVQGKAEALPFASTCFDYALVVTTLCFVDDPTAMLKEAYRVLKPKGHLVVGFIDRTSTLGQHYRAHQTESVFYREATFFSASEVNELLDDAGFGPRVWVQTLSAPLTEVTTIEPLRAGCGAGAFVVVRAKRQ